MAVFLLQELDTAWNTTERYELTGGALELRKIASHMLSHETVCHVLSYKNVCRLNQWFQGCHRAT